MFGYRFNVDALAKVRMLRWAASSAPATQKQLRRIPTDVRALSVALFSSASKIRRFWTFYGTRNFTDNSYH
jgi:hypothetical protein